MRAIDKQTVLDEFDEQGFVVLEGVLDPAEDIQPVVDEYEDLLDRLSWDWYQEGKLSSTFEDLPFGKRLTEVARETEGGYYHNFDISLPQSAIDADTPMHTGPEAFALLRNERLLDAVEIFIGPEIFCNPVQHTRVKPPVAVLPEDKRFHAGIAKTQWHQDIGVVTEEADESNMLTVWLPVTEATEENGCLTVVPGSHRHGIDLHCVAPGGKTGIPDENISPDHISLPMKPGDVLFMTKYTQHGSLENVSIPSVGASTCATTRWGRRRDARGSPDSSRAAGRIPTANSTTPNGGPRGGPSPVTNSPPREHRSSVAGTRTTPFARNPFACHV